MHHESGEGSWGGQREGREASTLPCLFDLDGTLVDSEPLFEESQKEYLTGFGIDFSMELKRELFGTSSTTFFEIIEARFPGNPLNRLSLAQRHEGATRHYFETAHGRVKVFPVMAALVRELGHRGLPLAIASSSTHPIIDYNLGESGLAPLFRVRVSAVDVSRGKPAPDIMLEAARRLGFRPEACLVFEDSPLGLRAAKAAGMYCVSLPAPGSDLSKFSAADRLIEGGPGAAVLEELLAIVESRIKAASLS